MSSLNLENELGVVATCPQLRLMDLPYDHYRHRARAINQNGKAKIVGCVWLEEVVYSCDGGSGNYSNRVVKYVVMECWIPSCRQREASGGGHVHPTSDMGD